MARPPRRSLLTVTQQAVMLRRHFPEHPRPLVRRNRLVWIVALQPTPLSVTYRVRIEYVLGDRPHVTVIDPQLERPRGEPLPHVFPHDELCLYFREFDGRTDLIAKTIVPWASEWLYFYEVWLTTGEWHGGGVHPPRPTRVAG